MQSIAKQSFTKLSFANQSLTTFSLTLTLSLLLAASPAVAGWDDGVEAFKAGDFAQATRLFVDYIDQNPQAPQGHYMLGRSLLQENRLMEALGPLDHASSLAPAEASYRLVLAQAQLKAHRADAALATLGAQDLAVLPANQRVGFDALLARSAVASKDPAAAQRALSTALKSHGKSTSLWLALTRVERHLGNTAEAFSASSRAFELGSDAEVGVQAVQLGFSLARDEADDERQSWYRKASKVAEALVAKHPSPEHQLLAGEAQLGAKNFEAAANWFKQAALANAQDAIPHYYLASCALAEQRGDEALDHLDAADQRSPDEALGEQILLARGTALRQMGEFVKAAAIYRQAGKTDKVQEMETLADAKANNAQWDAAKKQCLRKQQDIRELMRDSEDLRDTPVWQELETEQANMLAECKSYFDESA